MDIVDVLPAYVEGRRSMDQVCFEIWAAMLASSYGGFISRVDGRVVNQHRGQKPKAT